jgi:hypothetical protein
VTPLAPDPYRAIRPRLPVPGHSARTTPRRRRRARLALDGRATSELIGTSVHQHLAVNAAKFPLDGDASGVRPLDSTTSDAELDPETRRVYLDALGALRRSGVEYLIGGAHALAPYTGIVRETKDLDVFLRKQDCAAALAALGAAGFTTDLTFPHWLGKAYAGDRFIDLIFGAGNGVAVVDDLWFTHASPGRVLDVPVLLCPAEEMIWSKAFIMERERYDGADVAHLILACGCHLDWHRLLLRFGRRWRVLLSHLILFGFVYPGERAVIPDWVMLNLLSRLERERIWPGKGARLCDGPLLSRQQYLIDVTERGYADGRLAPRGEMTAAEIAHWTAAISTDLEAVPRHAAPTPPMFHQSARPDSRARRRRR